MNQKSLESAVLQKRSDELDAREKYLNSQAELLDSAPVKIKTLESQILAKTEQLEGLQHDITATEARLISRRDSVGAELEELERKHEKSKGKIKSEYDDLAHQLDALEDAITDAQKKLKEINKDIDGRYHYFTSQEKEINAALESANDHLTNKKSASDELENEIHSLSLDKANLQREVDDLSIQISELQVKVTNLDTDFEHKSSSYKSQIDTLLDELASITKKTESAQIAQKRKDQELTIRETQLQVKADALALSIQELKEEKHRWESKKEFYSM